MNHPTHAYHAAELALRRIASESDGMHAEFFAELAAEVRARCEAVTGAAVGTLPTNSPGASCPPAIGVRPNETPDQTGPTVERDAPPSLADGRAQSLTKAERRSIAVQRLASLVGRYVDGYAAAGSQANERARAFLSEAVALANRWRESSQMATHAHGKVRAAINVMVAR